MVESTSGPDEAAKLDELAAVTREYAQHGTMGGLAMSVVGAWVLGTLAIGARWREAGVDLAVLTPLVWLGALAAARGYYHRRGAVRESVPGSELRWLFRAFTYGMCVLGVCEAESLGGLTMFLAAATFVAVPAIDARVTQGLSDTSFTMFVVQYASAFRFPRSGRWGLAFVVLGSVMFVAAGIGGHLKYRRLERRLAALKGAA